MQPRAHRSAPGGRPPGHLAGRPSQRGHASGRSRPQEQCFGEQRDEPLDPSGRNRHPGANRWCPARRTRLCPVQGAVFPGSLSELFLLNFIGFVVLTAVFLLSPRWLRARCWLVDVVLICYAAAALLAWVQAGGPNPLGLGYASKVTEVMLIVALLADLWILARRPQPRAARLVGRRRHEVVILGGGFGGVYVALELQKHLRHEDVGVTLISRDNYFLFQPMLAELVSGSIETQHILNPLRRLLPHVQVLCGEVEAIDLQAREVSVDTGFEDRQYPLAFDSLVVALGSVTDLSRFPGLAEHAIMAKTVGDAFGLRNHALDMLEKADVEGDPEERQRLLTFVVAGGGSPASKCWPSCRTSSTTPSACTRASSTAICGCS